MEPKKMYIDGEWVTGSMEKPFDVINPATGEVLAQVYESSEEDTRRAIARQRNHFTRQESGVIWIPRPEVI